MNTNVLVEFTNGITLYDFEEWGWVIDPSDHWTVQDLRNDIAESLGYPEPALAFLLNYGPMPVGVAFDEIQFGDIIEVGFA